MKARPRLLLVDDHALMVEGISAMLEPDHDIVGVEGDGRRALGAVDRYKPDVVLLDISLPGRSGLEICADIRKHYADVAVVIVTMHADRIYADEALKVGALGYVLKSARAEELRFAIGEAMEGRAYVTPALKEAEVRQARLDPRGHPGAGGLEALTPRQREVLVMIARGRTGDEIAEALGLSAKSVEFHRSRIKHLLGLNSTAALVRYAVAEGLV
jgi:DNA-binding NarL/FixJ family response regulator